MEEEIAAIGTDYCLGDEGDVDLIYRRCDRIQCIGIFTCDTCLFSPVTPVTGENPRVEGVPGENPRVEGVTGENPFLVPQYSLALFASHL